MPGPHRRDRPFAAVAGVASVVAGLGVGEFAAALIAPQSGPLVAVGSLLVDLAPPWAKDAAIALFGTGDKAALVTGIVIVLALAAAGAGLLELARPPWGRVLLGAIGIVGVAAAMSRANAPMLAFVPPAIAAAVAIVALGVLMSRMPRADAAAEAEASASPARPELPGRRAFLAWAGGTALLGVLAAAGGAAMQAGGRAMVALRSAVRLPAPTATVSVPASAEYGVPGLAPLVTPNNGFYRIDTALAVPRVDPADWKLRIHGMVEHEFELSWDELLALPLSESATTLTCVSNEVGGGLIGNAVWLGTPIRDLLARARPLADADMVLSRSVDGFTASTPIEVLRDDRNAILAVGMNGVPLPLDHGFPVRMVVPGLYGYVSATKWVAELEVTRFDEASAYWTDRGWSERGPIKLSSRIDVPRAGRPLAAGAVTVAGVAWHQHTGVSGVEVQVDDGPWRAAELATAMSVDTWVQWRFAWDAAAGDHTLRVRAIGADGEVQTAKERPVVPDGATGLHEVHVSVVE
ncbi:molybdopterin-dependent oxidoreductase [Agromyces soli]